MLMSAIKKSGLYDSTDVIRVGVLSENSQLVVNKNIETALWCTEDAYVDVKDILLENIDSTEELRATNTLFLNDPQFGIVKVLNITFTDGTSQTINEGDPFYFNKPNISGNNELLDDPKFQIVTIGDASEYERATLHHMRKSSETDDSSTLYYYLHTKGIRHFGTGNEENVIDWIDLMLYWNIEKWQLAVDVLNTAEYDTYGCNYLNNHYSGNFWWAKSSHIKNLKTNIGPLYNDPEEWVCSEKHLGYNAHSSGLEGMGHYWHRYPRERYAMK